MRILVIPTAGNATRMGDICHTFPKGLVNYHQHPAIVHILDFHDFDRAIIVCKSEHHGILKAYLSDRDIEYVINDSAAGTAEIFHSLNETLSGHNVIINWCDVIPLEMTEQSGFTAYTCDGTGRYIVKDNRFVEDKNGDVAGIYTYFPYDSISDSGEDIADVVGFVRASPAKVVDIGSYKKLKDTASTIPKCRYFNELTIDGDIVTKRAVTKFGKLKLKGERDVYLENRPNYAKIIGYSDNEIQMEFVDGKTLAEDPTPENLKATLVALKDAQEVRVNRAQLISDITEEAYTKIVTRTMEVRPLIEEVERITGVVRIVDGVDISGLSVHSFARLAEELIDCANYYHRIHGDPIPSNVIIRDDKPVFIDPRGYFGKSSSGMLEYDISKVLYGMSGFNKFNYDVTHKSPIVVDGHASLDITPSCEYDSERIVDIWIAIHWMSVAGFFRNNPAKVMTAYYNGLKLCKLILSH